MISVRTRPENTNGRAGFVIEVDGYPFEACMEEAAVVLHALRTEGEAAALQAYAGVIKARIA